MAGMAAGGQRGRIDRQAVGVTLVVRRNAAVDSIDDLESQFASGCIALSAPHPQVAEVDLPNIQVEGMVNG